MSAELQHALDGGRLRTHLQPIVDLDRGEVVAHEALTRGPAGSPLERPDRLFDAARAAGRAAELDAACVRAALATAADLHLAGELFVNVEPLTLTPGLLDGVAPTLPIVVELTERALVSRPAELLATVAAARRRGWGIALDDVGADHRSLALLPIVQPDVVKLDMALIQARPDRLTAAIATAVQAEAERSGMRILAEGIETDAQLRFARSLGARLGQGHHLGRPSPVPAPVVVRDAPVRRHDVRPVPAATPAELVGARQGLRRATKPLLLEISTHLERQALTVGDTAIVLGTFQHDRYFHGATVDRYVELGRRCAVAGAFGTGMSPAPAPGVRGGRLAAGDPLTGEWDLVVIGAHFAAALVAVDLGDDGSEADRRFDYLVTYDRATVADLARSLLARIWPDLRGADRLVPHREAALAGARPA